MSIPQVHNSKPQIFFGNYFHFFLPRILPSISKVLYEQILFHNRPDTATVELFLSGVKSLFWHYIFIKLWTLKIKHSLICKLNDTQPHKRYIISHIQWLSRLLKLLPYYNWLQTNYVNVNLSNNVSYWHAKILHWSTVTVLCGKNTCLGAIQCNIFKLLPTSYNNRLIFQWPVFIQFILWILSGNQTEWLRSIK